MSKGSSPSRAKSFFSKPSNWLGLLFVGIAIWFLWIVVKAIGSLEQDYANGLSASEQFLANLKSNLPSWLGGDSGSSSSSSSTSHWWNPFSWFGSSGGNSSSGGDDPSPSSSDYNNSDGTTTTGGGIDG